MRKIILFICLSSLLIQTASLTLEKAAQKYVEPQHIHYMCTDQKITFNAELLYRSGVINGCTTHFLNSPVALHFVPSFFKNMNSMHAQMLIEALEANSNIPLAQMFVQQCEQKDLFWLISQCGQWDIHYVYEALLQRIKEEIKRPATLQQYIISDLTDPIAIRDIHPLLNLSYAYDHIIKCNKQFCPPAACSINYIHSVKVTPSRKIVIADRSKLHIYDAAQETVLVPHLGIQTNIISVFWNEDETKIYLHTPFQIYSYDLITQETRTHYSSLNQGLIKNIHFNSDNTKVLISFEDKSLLYDMIKEETESSFPHGFYEASFKNNDTQLLMRTDNRDVIVYDVIHHTSALYSFNDRFCNCIAADISSDGTRLLMTSEEKCMIINLITGQKEFEYTYDNNGYFYCHNASAHFSANNKQLILFYHTGNLITVHIYDQETHHMTTTCYEAKATAREQDTLIAKLVYNNRQLICVKRRRVECYAIYSGKLLWRIDFVCNQEGDSAYMYHAGISDDGNQLVVIPGLFVPEAYIFTLIDLEQLDIHQQLLCAKACYFWQQQQPYVVPAQEVTIYQSLPNSLQKEKLFLIKQE